MIPAASLIEGHPFPLHRCVLFICVGAKNETGEQARVSSGEPWVKAVRLIYEKSQCPKGEMEVF